MSAEAASRGAEESCQDFDTALVKGGQAQKASDMTLEKATRQRKHAEGNVAVVEQALSALGEQAQRCQAEPRGTGCQRHAWEARLSAIEEQRRAAEDDLFDALSELERFVEFEQLELDEAKRSGNWVCSCATVLESESVPDTPLTPQEQPVWEEAVADATIASAASSLSAAVREPQRGAMPAVQCIAQLAVHPAKQPTVHSVAQQSAQPAVQPVAQSAAQCATQHVIHLAAQPTVQPSAHCRVPVAPGQRTRMMRTVAGSTTGASTLATRIPAGEGRRHSPSPRPTAAAVLTAAPVIATAVLARNPSPRRPLSPQKPGTSTVAQSRPQSPTRGKSPGRPQSPSRQSTGTVSPAWPVRPRSPGNFRRGPGLAPRSGQKSPPRARAGGDVAVAIGSSNAEIELRAKLAAMPDHELRRVLTRLPRERLESALAAQASSSVSASGARCFGA